MKKVFRMKKKPSTSKIYVTKKQYDNARKFLYYLDSVPWDCIDQVNGTMYDGDHFQKCCFGAHGTRFFCKEIKAMDCWTVNRWSFLADESEDNVHNRIDSGWYEFFEYKMRELIGLSEAMLTDAGASHDPFGFAEWPVHPKKVLATCIERMEVRK